MSRLQEFWSDFKVRFLNLVKKFEESAIFERIMLKFESLTPSTQKSLQTITKIAFIVFLILVFTYPLYSIFSSRAKLSNLEKLHSELAGFDSVLSRSQLEIGTPTGWKILNASSINSFKDTFEDYLNSIGVPADIAKLVVQGNSLRLEVSELNIRQLINLSFQVEGLYPGAQFSDFNVTVHPENKETLTFQGTINLNPQLAQKIANAGSGSRGGRSSLPSPPPNQGNDPSPPSPRNSRVNSRPTPPPAPKPSLPAPSRRDSNRDDYGVDDTDPRDNYGNDAVGAPPPGGDYPEEDNYIGPDDYDEGMGMPPDEFDDADIPPDMIPPPPPVFDE